MVSPKFIATLMVLALGIAIGWTVCIQQYNRPDIFAFLIGGLLLVEVAIGMQHFRNIVLFHHARRAEGVQGKIEYTKRLTLTLSYTELYGLVVLYLMTFLVTSSWFFLGGALTCFVASRRYQDWVIMRT